jgi:hypothetical protein
MVFYDFSDERGYPLVRRGQFQTFPGRKATQDFAFYPSNGCWFDLTFYEY